MTNQHPITLPTGLVDKWSEEWHRSEDDNTSFEAWMLAHAAQWGADQELEACCEWVTMETPASEVHLRGARRPKPPSLKEQAMALLDMAEDPSWDINDFSIVRRALEALPE
jgi:hypothetical protein